ncbi:MAG TPA: RNA polymerase sigma factor [Pseudomonadota bacterium]|nr:RNA polymerase sigma factor [Pseudomonadota bacterium]
MHVTEIAYRPESSSVFLRVWVRDEANETLMVRFRGGDPRAFELLLERHQKPIFQFVFRSVGVKAVAEELTQETFLRVIKQKDHYEERARFTTWLYTLARNLCIDHSRRMQHRRAKSLDAVDEEGHSLLERTADKALSVERQAVSEELQKKLRAAIETLPDDQREVFLLREEADLSFKEIAEIVGISENTVKSRMRYALTKLRSLLEEYEDMARALS